MPRELQHILIRACVGGLNAHVAQDDGVFLIGLLKDLRGIDLSGFSTVEAELLELNDVLYDSTTKWPEGFTPPA